MTAIDNLAEHLARTAREQGWLERPAYLADGAVHRYADVFAGADRMAANLSASGVRRGERVLASLPDGMDLIWTILGTLRLGAIVALVNTDLHPDELRQTAELAGARLTVADPRVADVFDGPTVTPAMIRAEQDQAAVPPAADCARDTPGIALLTSGTTTGRPRLCFHTHGDPHVFDSAFGRVLDLRPGDVSLSVSRMYFSYGLGNTLFYPLLSGSAAVLTPRRPTPAEALAAIRDLGVTVFYAQPSFYARLLAEPDLSPLAGLRLAVTAGEVLAPALEGALREVLGGRLLNVLGTTEVGQVFAASPPSETREGTVGRALPPFRIQLVDDEGEPVPSGAEGNLQVAGPTIAPGIGSPAESPRHGESSWWPTGDTATMDDDGYLRVLGRADDIEIVGGQNVHPAEIEDVLARHPLVLEAAVCSTRAQDGTSKLLAFLIAKGDESDHATIRGELADAAKKQLTWYKVPSEIVFVTELPRTSTGKLSRRDLRARAAG
ncbi:class I adenylate-forming enzyme family protein [Nonomuraea dietziae]|uniref:class I adenylate-forming enzyme family protein n=1 Tax=Nonomuraea dietziae TaxID=65515 RepID=UPI0033F0C5B2